MPSEKMRSEWYSEAKRIYNRASQHDGLDHYKVLIEELEKIEDENARAAIEMVVWMWGKEGAEPNAPWIASALSVISRATPGPRLRAIIYPSILAIVVLPFFFFGQKSMTSSGDIAGVETDQLRSWRAESGKSLIVFVHGIRDDGEDTWTNKATQARWPELLISDPRFEEFDIMTYHYSSLLFEGHGLSISNVADRLSFRLDDDLMTQYDKVVFIAHSMGGLVVRNFLLKERQLSKKVPLVYFLATPTAGSDIAKLATALGFKNRQLEALQSFRKSNFLEDQNSQWRAWPGSREIYSLCAFETRKTNGIIVVDSSSAQSLCSGQTLPAEQSHSGIAKPSSRSSLVYKVFADKLTQLDLF